MILFILFLTIALGIGNHYNKNRFQLNIQQEHQDHGEDAGEDIKEFIFYIKNKSVMED